MKKVLKVAGIGIALTAIGVAIRANREDIKIINSELNRKPGLRAIDLLHVRIDELEEKI